MNGDLLLPAMSLRKSIKPLCSLTNISNIPKPFSKRNQPLNYSPTHYSLRKTYHKNKEKGNGCELSRIDYSKIVCDIFSNSSYPNKSKTVKIRLVDKRETLSELNTFNEKCAITIPVTRKNSNSPDSYSVKGKIIKNLIGNNKTHVAKKPSLETLENMIDFVSLPDGYVVLKPKHTKAQATKKMMTPLSKLTHIILEKKLITTSGPYVKGSKAHVNYINSIKPVLKRHRVNWPLTKKFR